MWSKSIEMMGALGYVPQEPPRSGYLVRGNAKSCPACGSKELSLCYTFSPREGFIVECDKCHAMSKPRPTWRWAILSWNHRAHWHN